MAMAIENLGFSAPTDRHHQPHNSLRPFIPEIISLGGGARGALLPLFDEKHDLETALSLSMAVSSNSTTADSVAVGDDEVDAIPSLISNVSIDSTSSIYNPMPLRCFDPTTSNQAAGKRKRGGGDGNGGGSRKRGKRSSSNGGDEDRLRPSISIGEFPELVRALELRNVDINGGGAVFLYRKRLEESDVRGDQNRLFVTGREAVMEFLTAEEAVAVDESSEGVRILGVDEGGKAYKLVMKKWKSLNVTVINSDWNKLVAANGARKGDAVEIWGFHDECGKLGFAIVFRR